MTASAICLTHLQWRDKLLDGVLNGRVPEIQLDGTQCALGKWIESPESSQAPTALVAPLRAIHADLHRRAGTILQSMRDGIDTSSLLARVHEEITPALNETWERLKALIDAQHAAAHAGTGASAAGWHTHPVAT